MSNSLPLSSLTLGKQTLLRDLPDTVSLRADRLAVGQLLSITVEAQAARLVVPIGQLAGVHRFMALARYDPFWVRPQMGRCGGQVPSETQFLLVECVDGGYAVFVPLIDPVFRATLQGEGEDGLALVIESGDPAAVTNAMSALFIAVGDSPYQLVDEAARAVLAQTQSGRLRRDKALPGFIDTLGWSTWNAFYHDVTHDKIRQALSALRQAGIQPRYLLLDDGWQTVAQFPTGESRLTAFAADPSKFPGDLAPTVRMSKEAFGIETFLVWNTLCGYWGGVDPMSFPHYAIQLVERHYSPGITQQAPTIEGWWGRIVGLVAPQDAHRFFQDYYQHLRQQGVDGVKSDSQAMLEGLGTGHGGRVAMMRTFHAALEGAVQTHFLGNLINCMSNSNEMIYSLLNSTLTRTYTDFWPDRPESNGDHLYSNALASLWSTQFVHPDWDMFQSGHPAGAYHAAGRVVSGGAVCAADAPDNFDFALMRKLALSDGTILRPRHPGLPTRDCLFDDATQEPILLKIFNHNIGAGLLGVFHARWQEGRNEPITGHFSPGDVEGLAGDSFAVFAHHSQEVRLLARHDRASLTLPQLGFELFTIVPIAQSRAAAIAPIGLIDYFNSGGAVLAQEWLTDWIYRVRLRGDGGCWLYCHPRPTRILVNGTAMHFEYNKETHVASFCLNDVKESIVQVEFGNR